MTTTDLPPIGSVWVHKQNPHDIAIVVGHSKIQLKHVDAKEHKLVMLHKLQHDTRTSEITTTFTWLYKPLEQGQ
jgi:hypothetical protein